MSNISGLMSFGIGTMSAMHYGTSLRGHGDDSVKDENLDSVEGEDAVVEDGYGIVDASFTEPDDQMNEISTKEPTKNPQLFLRPGFVTSLEYYPGIVWAPNTMPHIRGPDDEELKEFLWIRNCTRDPYEVVEENTEVQLNAQDADSNASGAASQKPTEGACNASAAVSEKSCEAASNSSAVKRHRNTSQGEDTSQDDALAAHVFGIHAKALESVKQEIKVELYEREQELADAKAVLKQATLWGQSQKVKTEHVKTENAKTENVKVENVKGSVVIPPRKKVPDIVIQKEPAAKAPVVVPPRRKVPVPDIETEKEPKVQGVVIPPRIQNVARIQEQSKAEQPSKPPLPKFKPPARLLSTSTIDHVRGSVEQNQSVQAPKPWGPAPPKFRPPAHLLPKASNKSGESNTAV